MEQITNVKDAALDELLVPTSLAHAYPIATRRLGKARARLHRLLNDVAFVRLAEPPPTAIACRRNDEHLLRRHVGNSTSHRLFKTNSHEFSCRPGADHTFGMHRERQTLPLS